eukprot:5691513-Heterocapsa_arctica.AAC.1
MIKHKPSANKKAHRNGFSATLSVELQHVPILALILSPRLQEDHTRNHGTGTPSSQPEPMTVPMEQEPGTHTSDVWGWVHQQLALGLREANRRTLSDSSPEAHVTADLVARAWNVQGFDL